MRFLSKAHLHQFFILLLAAQMSATSHGQVAFDTAPAIIQNGFSIRDASNWQSRPECQDFIDYNQKSVNTFGLVVLKNGRSELEMFGRGATENNLFKLWSVSKTFTSLWLGTEIQNGTLNLETPVTRVLTELAPSKDEDWSPEYRKRLRVRHLWTFSSGLDWCEAEFCNASPLLEMYYGAQSKDALKFISTRGIRNAPGRTYRYSSADVTMLSAMIQRLQSQQAYETSPERNLFKPLGIKNWVLKRDQKNLYLSGANLFLGTRDTAKLGQLILQRGRWAKESTGEKVALMPASFFQEMIQTSRAIRSPETPEDIRSYEGPSGGLVWLNETIPGIQKFLRRAPDNTIYTNGAFGQFLMVFPSAGIVIARNGGDSDYGDVWEPFVEKALSCFAPNQLKPEDKSKQAPAPQTVLLDFLKLFNTLRSGNTTARLAAVEYCDCLFVEKFSSLKSCETLLANDQVKDYFPPKTKIDWENKSVSVQTVFQDPTKVLLESTVSTARAVYRPRNAHDGCSLE